MKRAGAEFERAVEIMARLRGPEGCPWDREQTFDSIKKHTLEEVYEVFDAIERRDWPELKAELGDLQLQILFYAQMAEEQGDFSAVDVLETLSDKLVRRHPHVFGDAKAETASDVNRVWEAVKQTERAPRAEGLLSDVPRSMPALMEAGKVTSKAAKVGFDWTDAREIFEKLHEEEAELRVEMDAAEPDEQKIFEEFGDLLFVVANLARKLGVSPEEALRSANAKFRRRFGAMEKFAGSTDALAKLSAEEKEALWARAKQEEHA